MKCVLSTASVLLLALLVLPACSEEVDPPVPPLVDDDDSGDDDDSAANDDDSTSGDDDDSTSGDDDDSTSGDDDDSTSGDDDDSAAGDDDDAAGDDDDSTPTVSACGFYIGSDLEIHDNDYDGTQGSMTCGDVWVGPSGPFVEASVTLGMDHTYVGDLVIKLFSPSGTPVTLLSRPGQDEMLDDGSECCGDSSDLLASSPISFANAGTHDAELMGDTINGGGVVCQDDSECDFFPNPHFASGVFSDLLGEEISGTWQLCVGDAWEYDIGSLQTVTLSLNGAACP